MFGDVIGTCSECGGQVVQTDTMDGPRVRCVRSGCVPRLRVIPMRRVSGTVSPVAILSTTIPSPAPYPEPSKWEMPHNPEWLQMFQTIVSGSV